MAEEAVETKDKVDVPLPQYAEYMELLDLPHALMKGTRGMRATGEKYLPKEINEEDSTYEARKKRTVLLNAFQRTVQKMTGEVFSKPITPSEEVPDYLTEMFTNVDGEGNSLDVYSQKVFTQDLVDGISHILVDYPNIKKREVKGILEFWYEPTDEEKEEGKLSEWRPFTKGTEEELGFRPIWVHLPAESIIGWRVKKVNGVLVTIQIRFTEVSYEDDGKYGTKKVERIRVIEPGRYEVHIKNIETGKWDLEEEGKTSLDYVPLVSIMFGEKLQDMIAQPPLEGLAFLNMLHWQSSSDQRNILHYARLVTYFGRLLSTDPKTKEVVVGPNRLIHGMDPQSDFKVVEHTGRGIEAGRNDLLDLEKQMGMFGLIYMMPQTGNITATQRAIESSENDSALLNWALIFQAGLNKALEYTADMLGEDSEKIGSLSINTEFKSLLNDVEADVLIKAFQTGLLPRQIIVEEFTRRGLITDEYDLADIIAMLEDDNRQNPLPERPPEGGANLELIGGGAE